MALPLPPRLAPSADAGNPAAGASTAPSVDPSAGASPVPGQGNPEALADMNDILSIVSSARRLGMKYPGAVPDVQSILDAVQRLQMSVMQAQPPSEVPAPPNV